MARFPNFTYTNACDLPRGSRPVYGLRLERAALNTNRHRSFGTNPGEGVYASPLKAKLLDARLFSTGVHRPRPSKTVPGCNHLVTRALCAFGKIRVNPLPSLSSTMDCAAFRLANPPPPATVAPEASSMITRGADEDAVSNQLAHCEHAKLQEMRMDHVPSREEGNDEWWSVISRL